MTESFRGGNSRLLARQLDQLSWPIVVLDQRCEIVFISAALCQLLQVDATRLVGLACKPELSPDDAPERELSMALAPPSDVLHGRAAVRQVPWPPKDPTGSAAQAFIPLIDEDPSQGLILILFGQSEVLHKRLQPLAPPQPPRGTAADEVLLRLRSQWQQLDGMWPLLGVSPAVELAMRRAQLAVQTGVGVYLSGPQGSGKAEIARMLYAQRARTLDVPASVVQALPIDCTMVDEPMAASLLETLAGRLRPGAPATAAHLILERLDHAGEASVRTINNWLAEHGHAVCVIATSEQPPQHVAARSEAMTRLVHAIGTLEIALPPLASRREDVAALAQQCLAHAAQRAGRRLPGIAKATMDLLEAYPWPGNAAELRQVATEMLANAVLTATIQPAHLPLQVRTFGGTLAVGKQPPLEAISLDQVLLDLERIMLERALKLSPRNRARAARLLGISRPRFLRRISQLGLDDRTATDEEE